MSATFARPASLPQIVRRSDARRAAFGLGAALAAVTAVGAAVAVFLAPSAAPTARHLTYADLPTIGESAEYRDGVALITPAKSWADLPTLGAPAEYVDGIAILRAPAKTWADLPTIGPADEYRDGLALLAPSKTYRDLATLQGISHFFDEPIG